MMDIENAWNTLLNLGVSEETLQTVTDINGYNIESLNDICYSRFGYQSVEDLQEED